MTNFIIPKKQKDTTTNCEPFSVMQYSMPEVEGMDTQKEVVDLHTKINNFNKKYNRYIRCTNEKINKNNQLKCSDEEKNKANLTKEFTVLQNKLSGLSDNKNKMPISNASEFESSFNKMEEHVQIIQRLRNENKEKNKILQNKPDSFHEDKQKLYELTNYTNLMMTILGTTIIYYLFFKINR